MEEELYAVVFRDPNSSEDVRIMAVLPEAIAKRLCDCLNDSKHMLPDPDPDEYFEVLQVEFGIFNENFGVIEMFEAIMDLLSD